MKYHIFRKKLYFHVGTVSSVLVPYRIYTFYFAKTTEYTVHVLCTYFYDLKKKDTRMN